MLSLKLLAGLGTIFIFISFYLIKPALSRKALKEELRYVHYKPVKNYGRIYRIFLGCIVGAIGIWLLLKAFKAI
jgi:hypothetical protein